LKCITGNTLRDRIRNRDICNVCEIQDESAEDEHEEIMEAGWMTGLQKWESKYPQAIWTVSKTLVRKLDINITKVQAYWIK